jgi:hypothetical protein
MIFSKYSLALVFLLSMILSKTPGWAQTDIQNGKRNSPFSQPDDTRRGSNGIRIMFYNVENLFDIVNDSLTADDEYAAGGMRGWSYTRMIRKINNLSKAIIRVGGWEAPEIVGLCEVENRYVLSNLAMDSPLKNFGYKIIHRDSPDPRGIDVALLYRSEKFRPLSTQFIGIHFPFDPYARTRDILYVQGVVLNRDTVNIFVNH